MKEMEIVNYTIFFYLYTLLMSVDEQILRILLFFNFYALYFRKKHCYKNY